MKRTYLALIVLGVAVIVGVGFSNCSGYKSADTEEQQATANNIPNLTRIKYTVGMGFAPGTYPTPTLNMLYANGRVQATLDYGACDLNATLDNATFDRLLQMIRNAPRVTGDVSVADTGDPKVIVSDESGPTPISTEIYLDGRTGSIADNGKTNKAIYNIINRMQLYCANVINTVSYDRSSSASGISMNFEFTLITVGTVTTVTDVRASGSIWTQTPACSKQFTNEALPTSVKNAFANAQLGARTSLCVNPPAGAGKIYLMLNDQRGIHVDLDCSDPVGITNLQALYDALNSWLSTQSGVCLSNPVFKD